MGRDRYNAKGNPKIDAQDEGVSVLTAPLKKLNWSGAGVTASESAPGEVDLVIPGGGAAAALVPSKEWYIDKANAASTEDGSIQNPYKTIQGAIDAAAGNTVMHITPGNYAEDLSIIKNGIQLKGPNVTTGQASAVTISGSVTVANTGVTTISGLFIYPGVDVDKHALDYSGAGNQKLFMYNVSVRCDSVGVFNTLNDTNTGDSEITSRDCLFRHSNTPGGGRPWFCSAGSVGTRRFFKGNFLASDVLFNNIAIEKNGDASLEILMEDIQGQVSITGGQWIIEKTRLTTGTVPVLTTTSTFLLAHVFERNQVITLASPAVTGTGDVSHAGNIYELGGGGFAPTLNGGGGAVALPFEGADNTVYDPSTSGYPFVSTRVRGALDEIGAILAASQPTVDVEDEGVSILTALLNTLNFTGAGVSVSEGAAGEAIIDVSGAATSLSGISNQRYFILGSHNFSTGQYDALRIASNGNASVVFAVPDDFGSLTSLEAIGIPEGTGDTKDIDLLSNYAAEGEDLATHAESDLASTYDGFIADQIYALPLTSVFSSLALGDYGGVNIDHNNIGFAVNYIALKIDYVIA